MPPSYCLGLGKHQCTGRCVVEQSGAHSGEESREVRTRAKASGVSGHAAPGASGLGVLADSPPGMGARIQSTGSRIPLTP